MCHRGLPGLLPLAIADPIAQHEHSIDVLPTPAHTSAFEACFDDQLVSTFHAARANGPACLLVLWVLHVRLTLLQIGQFLVYEWAGRERCQPAQVSEHPCWSLVFEPVQHALKPACRQSASCCLHGLSDVVDILRGM